MTEQILPCFFFIQSSIYSPIDQLTTPPPFHKSATSIMCLRRGTMANGSNNNDNISARTPWSVWEVTNNHIMTGLQSGITLCLLHCRACHCHIMPVPKLHRTCDVSGHVTFILCHQTSKRGLWVPKDSKGGPWCHNGLHFQWNLHCQNEAGQNVNSRLACIFKTVGKPYKEEDSNVSFDNCHGGRIKVVVVGWDLGLLAWPTFTCDNLHFPAIPLCHHETKSAQLIDNHVHPSEAFGEFFSFTMCRLQNLFIEVQLCSCQCAKMTIWYTLTLTGSFSHNTKLVPFALTQFWLI